MSIIFSLLFAGLYIACLGPALVNRDVIFEEEEEYPDWVETYLVFPWTYFVNWLIIPYFIGVRMALSEDFRAFHVEVQMEENLQYEKMFKERLKEEVDKPDEP